MSNTNANGFLPESYEAPKNQSAYMKFEQGDNKFRILASPVIGWLDWDDKKPVRTRLDNKPTKSIDPAKPVKQFWALPVFDYKDNKVKVLEITQKGLINSLTEYARSSDWGSPINYDITVNKKGQDKSTEYILLPSPPKELSNAIKVVWESTKINLFALFENGDPFAG